MKNVDVNFLYARGDQLRRSLIDIERAYNYVNKLEETARGSSSPRSFGKIA
jgi:hypothetical protein